MTKIAAIQTWMEEHCVSVAFINNPHHITYLTGLESDPKERVLALIISANEHFIFAPLLDAEDARKHVDTVYGYMDNENPWTLIGEKVAQHNFDTTSFAIEKNYLTVERYENLRQVFDKPIMDSDITPLLQEMMLIKTPEEIAIMHEAGAYADLALKVGMEAIAEGVSETEIVAKIEYEMKKVGITHMSFDTIVLAGDHAASPHGNPGTRKIVPNEFVLFDLGVVHNGYTSDVTRTVAFGTPSDKAKEVYDVVLRAQVAALAAIKPGVTAGYLDAVARDIITEAGYGAYFTHRLGHGLGASVHEYPSIMEGSDFVIREGMCFSIEPGIYIPDVVGVRIEDCVVVTATGADVFTHTPKEYREI